MAWLDRKSESLRGHPPGRQQSRRQGRAIQRSSNQPDLVIPLPAAMDSLSRFGHLGFDVLTRLMEETRKPDGLSRWRLLLQQIRERNAGRRGPQ